MNPIKLKILSVIFFTFFIFNLHGQEHKTDTIPTGLKKNAVYGSITYISDGYIGFRGLSINAERMLWNTGGFINSIWIRFGDWGGGHGTHLIGGITALTGSRASHFEVNLGVASFRSKNNTEEVVEKDVFPAAALGYRFQKPGDNLVFRTGIGFPERLYLSFGFCF
jgi:hypothetical protein